METEKKEDTKSLTELTLEIQMMALTVSQVQPEDQEVFFEKLQNELSSNFSKKIDNYGFFQQRLKLEKEFAKKEFEEKRAQVKFIERTEEFIKENLKRNMTILAMKEASGNDWRFVLSATKERLSVNEEELDKKFKIEVTSWVPDNERIREALENGETIKGASLLGGFSIRQYPNRGIK